MKFILCSVIFIHTILSFSQTNNSPDINTLSDSAMEKQSRTTMNNNESAYFIDSVFVYQNTIKNFDTQNIKVINLIKGKDTIIEKKRFENQIYITTKKPKQHQLLTLEQIKATLTGSTSPTIYVLNNRFITDAIETYKIDRSYILKTEKINTNSFYSLKSSNLNIDIIIITTKTKENIEKEKAKIYQKIEK